MRNIYSTIHCSTADAPIQITNSTAGFNGVASEAVVWFNAKARASNGAAIYVGNSSSVSSTNGFELGGGDSLPEEYRNTDAQASVSGARFWVVSSSTTAQLDYSLGLEN